MKIVGYLDNDKKALRQLRELREGVLRDRVFEALEQGAQQVAEEAAFRAPKRTGALAKSIKMRANKKSMTARVYADYPNTGRTRKTKTRKQKAGAREYYAMAMEYGTRRVKAQPFLMPAGEAKAKAVMEGIENAMEDALHDTGSTV